MQIVNEHNENVEWYKNNTDAIDAAGDKAREAAASAAAAAKSANAAGEKASQASQSASAAASSQSAASASATAAKKSETNAAASQKSAATSASTATTKASEAATSARDAAASKEAAKSSETSAASSASNAASSATAAGNSAKAAKTSETNARSSETAAGQSASAAAGSKTAAASSASAASTSAGQASASATAAGKSAESAASSASTATTKAGEATEQASAAARSASAAKTSETNAKASETSAESSKTAAASSASSAASSASSASASKDEATRQASAAKGSATTASTKATEAAGSATAAAQSKSTAESAATRAETAAKRAEDIASAVALEDASTTKKGIVQLSSATNSTSESLAATPKAVKAAYDLANGKYTAQDATTAQKGIVQLSSATNSASETLAATPKAVKAANDNANGRVPSARKVNGKALSADITLTPKDIGTLNSTTMSYSGGAGWYKLATVTMPQASSVVSITLIGGAGFNVGSPQQAGISELVLRAGNGNPKGITGALWRRTSTGFTNFAWVNTSGDTYDIYVEIGNYATSVNIHWDCTANASVSVYTSPTHSASKPSSVTDGVVYTMYSSHHKPTPLDIGALPTTGGTVSGPLSVTGGITGTLNGNASTATKLQTARSIGGVGFDGSANINLPGVNTTGNQNTTGNAATATKLQTARTIGGVSFDGTANINLPGVNTTGNQNTTGNAATATKLQTARNINGVKFDGSGDININTLVSRGRVTALSGSTQGTAGIQMYEAYNNSYPTTYGNVLHMKGASAAGEGELLIGWSGTSGAHAPVFIRSRRDNTGAAWSAWAQVYTAKDSIPGVNTTGNQNTTGNAATATKLQTARKIAGVAFDGSADITLTAANLNAYTKTEVTNLLSSYVKSSALPSMTVRTSSISGGDMGMSLSTFISHLKSNGAFSKRYWIGFGDAMGFNAGSINNITGFGAVELAESIIEVFNLPNGDYTIRLTTSHKADYGGVTNAILVYHYRSNRSPSGQWLKFAGTVGATSN
ncbi:tail fiber protein [Escherichia coli]